MTLFWGVAIGYWAGFICASILRVPEPPVPPRNQPEFWASLYERSEK